MRHVKPVRSTKIRTVFAVLIVLSAGLALAPRSWTYWLISPMQVLVPFQDGVVSAVDAVTDRSAGGGGSMVPAEQLEAARMAKEAADHHRVSLAVRVDELEREVTALSRSRFWEVEGSRIGDRGRLIPARVITGDLLAWRSSRLLGAGSGQGVRRGAAVVSNHFTIDRGGQSEVRAGMAILLGETLVGVIEQVGTHTSRVQLVSDVAVEMKVRIGRIEADRVRLADGYFWLRGRGEGRMEIRDVSRRDTDTGVVRTGDWVLSDSASPTLPAAMVIGKVREITEDRREPLFSILAIESIIAPGQLERVYVFDLGEN